MKQLIFIIILLILGLNIRCSTSSDGRIDSIGLFDISPDDKKILFSYGKTDGSSIYEITIDSNSLRTAIPSTLDSIFFNPKYSKSLNKILFLARSKRGNLNTDIYISERDGSHKQRLTKNNEVITEAFFSECEDKIYYCNAIEYGHSSPLVSDQPHAVDIYSVNIQDGLTKRVTYLNAYGLFRPSEYDCTNIIMSLPFGANGSMVMFSKSSPEKLHSINPQNNPRSDVSLYDTPVYSKKYKTIAFIATYQLMMMDMNDKIAKVVVDNAGKPQINNLVLFNRTRRLIYTTAGNTKFNIVNYNGKDLKTININL